MEPLLACCGLDCAGCPAFIARRDNNDELREKTAREWSEQFKIEISPGNIDCAGCLSEGVHGPYCSACEIRACAMEKALENCAYCPDYGCEKLAKVHAMDAHCKQRLDAVRSGL